MRRSSGRTSWWMLLVFLVASVGLGACAETRDVSVGSASASVLDLSVCTDTDCSREVASQPLEITGETTCDPGAPVTIGKVWEKRPEMIFECEESDLCRHDGMFQMALAADGSLWVTDTVTNAGQQSNVGGMWLANYTADGEPLHASIVDFHVAETDRGVGYFIDLVPDSRAGVWVAVHRFEYAQSDSRNWTRSWLAQFDERGEQVGERIPISGDRSRLFLSKAGPDSFALGQPELEGGGIALLGPDGTPRWTQTGVAGVKLLSLVADEDERVTAHSRRVGRSGLETFGVQQFGADGRLLWERSLPAPPAPLNGERWSAGSDGTLIRTGYAVPPNPFVVQKISPDGNPLWSMRMADRVNAFGPVPFSVSAVVATDGDLYIQSYDPYVIDGEATLLALSPDGSTCRSFVIASLPGQLVVGPSGELFFVGRQFGFGRLQDLPAAP